MQTLWVSMPIIRNVVLGATQNRELQLQICAQAGITASELENPEIRVPLDQNIALMEAALHLGGDKDMGLHIGEQTTVSVLGMAGYLMQSSKNLLSALQNLQQYTSTFSRLFYFGIELRGDEAIYQVEPVSVWNDLSPETARHSLDIAFAATLHILRLLTGVPEYPLQVLYRYPRFSNISEHERILKCKPLFNQTCNALIFSREAVEKSIIGYNPALNEVFINLLQQRVGSETQTFPEQVRTVILELSRPLFPTLEEVADRMNLTSRTLQRKLHEENTTFRAETERIKEEFARQLLSSGSLTIQEISDRLGYADETAFRRAFKSWTGKTPKEFQSTQLNKV